MNVMAKAHNFARRYMNNANPPRRSYKDVFKNALRHFHKEFKKLQALQNAPVVNRNTHQLKEGDVVRHHGCLLKLTNKQRSLCHKDSEVYVFESVCLYRAPDASMPEHWVEREGGFRIQGNERAHWSVVQ